MDKRDEKLEKLLNWTKLAIVMGEDCARRMIPEEDHPESLYPSPPICEGTNYVEVLKSSLRLTIERQRGRDFCVKFFLETLEKLEDGSLEVKEIV